MKTYRILTLLLALTVFMLPAWAQTDLPPVPIPEVTNTAPVLNITPIDSASATVNGLLLILATVVAPMLVRLAKLLIPKIPTKLLPIVGPSIMVAANTLSDFAGGPSVNAIVAAFVGAAGTGLREVKEVFIPDDVKSNRVEPTKSILVTSKLPLLLLCGTLILTPGCDIINPQGIKPAAVEEGQDSVVVNAQRVQKTSLYAYNRMINWELNNRAVLPLEVSRAVDEARLHFLPNWEASRTALKEYEEARGSNLDDLHRLTTALSVAQSNFLKLTGSGSANDISGIFTALMDLKDAVNVLRQ